MSKRYRMYPTKKQEQAMVNHCGHTRFVWNLALEQCNHARQLGQYVDFKLWQRQLADARKDSWLGDGSSSVQQVALRDLNQAFQNWWKNPAHFGAPKFRSKNRGSQGFTVRDITIKKLNSKWATVMVPKCGRVKFKLSRPIGECGMGRVTLDRSGRWHISFSAVPDKIDGPGTGESTGIDRGVAISFQAADEESWQTPTLKPTEERKLKLLERKMPRQQKGSNRRNKTKRAIAVIKVRDKDRRKDLIEKATTELARKYDIVRIEKLNTVGMMASAKGTIEEPGKNVAQKRGLNRSIQQQGWGIFAQRLEDKIGDRLELVSAVNTSRRCYKCKHVAKESRENQAEFHCVKCGHKDNADVNAAKNIAAGHAVTGRGQMSNGSLDEASIPSRKLIEI